MNEATLKLMVEAMTTMASSIKEIHTENAEIKARLDEKEADKKKESEQVTDTELDEVFKHVHI